MKTRNFAKFTFVLALILGLAVTGLAQSGPPKEGDITVATDPVTTKAYSEFTVTATLKEKESGDAISDASLTYKVGKDENGDNLLQGDELYEEGTETTGTNGEAAHTFSDSAIKEPGTYMFKVIYDGSETYSSDVYFGSVEASKAATVLEVRTKHPRKADSTNHPIHGDSGRTILDRSDRFCSDGQSYTFIHTPVDPTGGDLVD